MARTQRIVEKRGANHGLHVVLTILTCGLWAITGWPIATAMGRKTVTRVPAPMPPQQQAPQQWQQQAPPQAYGQQHPPQQYGQQPPQNTTWGQPRQ